MKIALAIVLFLGLILGLKNYNDKQFNKQWSDLQDIRIQLDQLEKEQDVIESKVQNLYDGVTPGNTNLKDTGKASYYDYILKTGWSSKGHKVCATRDYKRGSTLRVTNLSNGKTVDCLVTDYGPDVSVHPDRIIDLSSHAFSLLADTKLGIINVSVQLQ